MKYGIEILPEPQVGDLVELIKEMSATPGARAVVLHLTGDYIKIRWINERQKGQRYTQDNGEYSSYNFRLVERM